MAKKRFAWVVLVLSLVVAVALIWHYRLPRVELITTELTAIEQRVVASGELRYQQVHQVAAEITGTVTARKVREGDQVQAEQLLITLDRQQADNALKQAQMLLTQALKSRQPQLQAALTEAIAQRQQAQRELDRRLDLAKRGFLSQEAVEQARLQLQRLQQQQQQALLANQDLSLQGAELRRLQEQVAAAQLSVDKTQIMAPFSGVILSKEVEQGDVVQPGQRLLTLADTGSLEVIMALDEQYSAPVSLGQRASVIIDAWPEQELTGQVSFIAPQVDASRGTLDIHIQLARWPAAIIPKHGMTASVTLHVAQRQQAVVLDRAVLAWDQQQQPFVWVLDAAQRLHKQVIELGLTNQQSVEVVKGLAPKQWVVIPQPSLRAGQRVRYDTQ